MAMLKTPKFKFAEIFQKLQSENGWTMFGVGVIKHPTKELYLEQTKALLASRCKLEAMSDSTVKVKMSAKIFKFHRSHKYEFPNGIVLDGIVAVDLR